VRCFLDALLKSKEDGIDDFDTIRILESSFNRLFLSVEHISNALILKEQGNYSKRHFGDFSKLKEFKDKYGLDVASSYQTTYTFRAYADYRKFPEIERNFDKEHLNEQIAKVKVLLASSLDMFKDKMEFKELIGTFKDRSKNDINS
jgi:hypothetical protein